MDFVWLLDRCHFVMTDSGGVQEEAPSLGKPVIVMRGKTERTEAVEAGVAKLVGSDRDLIVTEAQKLLADPSTYETMSRPHNPYGDGNAAKRIANHLAGVWMSTKCMRSICDSMRSQRFEG
jgi:UDP-N-acetylglucosamine 2-epimerase (non-hydrolysing)